MSIGLEAVSRMQYPGRVIIIGKSPSGSDVVMYAITGRSPSSQARRLELDTINKKILVKPTDEETLKTGNPDLLIYPSIIIADGIAVSNGKQTEDIPGLMNGGKNPVDILRNGLASWEYEPDSPNFTPRISGCVYNGAALCIFKRASDGSVQRNYFEMPLIPGRGGMIATYTGDNANPLPSFTGEPAAVELPYDNCNDASTALYQALGPRDGNDYRVSAAAVFMNKDKHYTVSIKNRH